MKSIVPNGDGHHHSQRDIAADGGTRDDASSTRLERAGDPHWDRVVEIASKLWIDGEYVIEMDRCPTQDFVDLQWAAHQAGRVLGGRSKVETSSARGSEVPTVTVTVTYVDSDGRGLQRAEEGLQNLLRHVLADQLRRDH